MNLSEVLKLRDDDLVEFDLSFPAFTVGKKYKVLRTPVGVYVYDDNGRGWPIADAINLEHHFRKV